MTTATRDLNSTGPYKVGMFVVTSTPDGYKELARIVRIFIRPDGLKRIRMEDEDGVRYTVYPDDVYHPAARQSWE